MSASEGRSVPYYCPFCGDQNLFPHSETHGQWECRDCRRVFSVKFIGLLQGSGEVNHAGAN